MRKPLIAVVVAILVMLFGITGYCFVWVMVLRLEGPRLFASLVLLGISIYLFRQFRSPPTVFVVVGCASLAVAHLHDFLIQFGIEHALFQVAGSDGYIMQGVFEPRENPLISVPADVLRYIGSVAIVGLAWLVVTVADATRKKLLIALLVIVGGAGGAVAADKVYEGVLFARLSPPEKKTIGVWGWTTIDAIGRMRVRPNHRWDIWFIESQRDEDHPNRRLVTHGRWTIDGTDFIYINDPGQLGGKLPVETNRIPLSDFGPHMMKIR
jgi:hypothetical protein